MGKWGPGVISPSHLFSLDLVAPPYGAHCLLNVPGLSFQNLRPLQAGSRARSGFGMACEALSKGLGPG